MKTKKSTKAIGNLFKNVSRFKELTSTQVSKLEWDPITKTLNFYDFDHNTWLPETYWHTDSQQCILFFKIEQALIRLDPLYKIVFYEN